MSHASRPMQYRLAGAGQPAVRVRSSPQESDHGGWISAPLQRRKALAVFRINIDGIGVEKLLNDGEVVVDDRQVQRRGVRRARGAQLGVCTPAEQEPNLGRVAHFRGFVQCCFPVKHWLGGTRLIIDVGAGVDEPLGLFRVPTSRLLDEPAGWVSRTPAGKHGQNWVIWDWASTRECIVDNNTGLWRHRPWIG